MIDPLYVDDDWDVTEGATAYTGLWLVCATVAAAALVAVLALIAWRKL